MNRGWFPALVLLIGCGLAGGCVSGESEAARQPAGDEHVEDTAAVGSLLLRELARIDTAASAIDSVFQPLPLLTPADEESLRSASNARQLATARAIGVPRGLAADRIEALTTEGRLIRLADTDHWAVRDLDHSQPLTVPAVQALLSEIGDRFQARLAALGVPPYRMEISSVLRTAADQEALRLVNPNAASGESTHEYGTTVDVLYSAFSAPVEPIVEIESSGIDWADTLLRRYAEVAAERVAARRSLEIKAILGHVLMEMQREGRVMVTLERQQPVFHMTVGAER